MNTVTHPTKVILWVDSLLDIERLSEELYTLSYLDRAIAAFLERGEVEVYVSEEHRKAIHRNPKNCTISIIQEQDKFEDIAKKYPQEYKIHMDQIFVANEEGVVYVFKQIDKDLSSSEKPIVSISSIEASPDKYALFYKMETFQAEEMKVLKKKMTFSLRKRKDIFLSWLIYRAISTRITMLVGKYSILTPNVVTFLGALACLVPLTQIHYPQHPAVQVFLGILIFIGMLLDGVDGELSRLRFQKSRFGLALDSISDMLFGFILIYVLGIYGVDYFQLSWIRWLVYLCVGVAIFGKIIQYLMIKGGKAQLDMSSYEYVDVDEESTPIQKLWYMIAQGGSYLARVDFMRSGILILAIFQKLHWYLFFIFFFTFFYIFLIMVQWSKFIKNKSMSRKNKEVAPVSS